MFIVKSHEFLHCRWMLMVRSQHVWWLNRWLFDSSFPRFHHFSCFSPHCSYLNPTNHWHGPPSNHRVETDSFASPRETMTRLKLFTWQAWKPWPWKPVDFRPWEQWVYHLYICIYVVYIYIYGKSCVYVSMYGCVSPIYNGYCLPVVNVCVYGRGCFWMFLDIYIYSCGSKPWYRPVFTSK